MTIKECRELKNLSCQEVAKSLKIGLDEYCSYEEFPEEMPVMLGLAFSLLVGIPYDNIFFGVAV